MGAHSTVVYVEPNIEIGQNDWRINDDYDRAPRLEDYCIALNIEVELGARDMQGHVKTLILQWSHEKDKEPTVSFMGGTKIGGYDIDGQNRNPRISGSSNNVENLTTYYADMYAGDLIHYGTTEMIGIKSVNIQYERGCVPIISIKFTDVRGFSLFQPQELNRNNLYDGIKGIDNDNAAQSFFQCFFKLPIPKYTITIKGFYGKPVSYVMMCDHFESNFNSETGDYDVDTRFIGYSYSFMTDIALEALLAAPYSDFGGKQYWEDNASRFVMNDKNGQPTIQIPKLMEIYQDFYKAIKTKDDKAIDITLTEEERYHTEEIAKLKAIVEKYKIWYETLFNFLKKQYNKRYCFEFRDNINDENSDWYRILILTNSKSIDKPNLGIDYEQYPEDVKNANNNLCTAIKEFNNSGDTFKKLEELSQDFSSYTRINLFNKCYVNHIDRKIKFGGFAKDFTLNKTEILNRMFYGVKTNSDNETPDTLAKKTSELKEFTLNTIYGDGVDQYTSAYLIDVDYSDIVRRINTLVADAARSNEDKDKAKKRKELNKSMLEKIGWYPSIENFTKIMMAHAETFMHMLYNVRQKSANRTPQTLGITIGPNGNASDVNVTSKNVPPFPRVIKDEIGDDGITRTVDAWVGDFNGSERFIEEDMVNGLFNGIGVVESIYKETNEFNGESYSMGESKPTSMVKFPITSFDFFLTKNPYGETKEMLDNPYEFIASVMLRMYNVLRLNNLRYEHNTIFPTDDFVRILGEIEAENFHELNGSLGVTLQRLLGNDNNEAAISPKSMISCVHSSDSSNGTTFEGCKKPWDDKTAFMNTDNFTPTISLFGNKYFQCFVSPLQGDLLKTVKEFKSKLQSNKVAIEDIDVVVDEIPNISSYKNSFITNPNFDNTTLLNSVFISDNFKQVSDILNYASTNFVNDTYSQFYNEIRETSFFNKDEYKKFVLPNGVFKPKMGVARGHVADENKKRKKGMVSYTSNMIENNSLKAYYDETSNELVGDDSKKNYKEKVSAYDTEKINDFVNEAENGNISTWTFTECRGFNKRGNLYNINPFSTLVNDFSRNKEETTSKKLLTAYVNSKETTSKKPLTAYVNSKERTKVDSSQLKNAVGIDTSVEKKVRFFLMGLDAVDYGKVKEHLTNRTFSYIPKLAVLQIGAALDVLQNYNAKSNDIVQDVIKLMTVVPSTFHNLSNYLNESSALVKLSYVKYYRKWFNQYSGTIIENFYTKPNYNELWMASYQYGERGTKRLLFDENNSFVNDLNSMLMRPVLVTKGTIWSSMTERELEKSPHKLPSGLVENYLDGFLTKLRKLNHIQVEEGSSAVKLAQEASSVTESMKKDLYRYLKLVYERWIPLTNEDEWEFEKFFEREGGHAFYFIDSYYNKIGDKLLINPQIICDWIARIVESKDTNTMMLGFMADILGKSRCMLYSIQNFMDLAKTDAMSMMFKPIPYNSMGKIDKHPDFVIVYPYQPSRYLNVDNGDFNDDSFMLNDELATPLPIRSRNPQEEGKTYYNIPAFGVSYGRQYQSYFKKVNVGMKSPIATVQSITAKHAILKSSQDIKQTTRAQDVYDIYATQAYTCEVEMMGCAWVQPLMYFVLTNVPMFKGSYMIQKVTHTITPGNMTTNFVGVRMPNVANKIEEEIFTDCDNEPSFEYYSNSITRENALANVDNDCPYKVYPLYESNPTISKNEMENANKAMDMLMSSSFTKAAAAGICGNIFKESSWQLHVGQPEGKGAFALCQWTSSGGRKAKLVKKYGTYPTFAQQMEFIYLEWSGVDAKYVDSTAHANYNNLQNATSPEVAAQIVCDSFERPFGKGATESDKQKEYAPRKEAARKYYNAYNNQSTSVNGSTPSQNIYEAFFNAVQKSLESTNRSTRLSRLVEKGKVKSPIDKEALKNEYVPIHGMKIVQANNGREHLGIVFDIILNGYYEYVQELYWVVPNTDGKTFNDEPSSIHVVVKDKVEGDRIIGIYHSENFKEVSNNFNGGDKFNERFLKSIAKRYQVAKEGSTYRHNAYFETEVPQLKNSLSVFSNMTIKECNTLMEEQGYGKGGVIVNQKIDNWDVGKSVNWLIDHSYPYANGNYNGKRICAFAVQQALIAGGCEYKNIVTENGNGYRTALNLLATKHWDLIQSGYTNSKQIQGITPQIGDIIGMTKGSEYSEAGHVCMYCGEEDGWISDYKQHKNVYVYSSKGKGQYWYIRYKGGGATTTRNPQLCLDKKCLPNNA